MTTFSPATLAALYAVATAEEVDELVGIMRDISAGHVTACEWKLKFVVEILQRLAQQAGQEINHGK